MKRILACKKWVWQMYIENNQKNSKQKDWNSLDRFIAWLRYRAIDRYVPEGGVMCDIGCGREAVFLKRHSTKIKVGYGFDFRQTDHTDGNINLWNNKDMDGLSVLPDNSCDAVFLIAVLEHLDDPNAVFSEALRVLKSGGRFVLTTPTKIAKPILETMAFRLHIINEDEIREHKHYYNKTEIKELYKKNGFSNYTYKLYMGGVNSLAIAERD